MIDFFIRQHDSMQCGVACLGMVCRIFGKGYSMDYLSSLSSSTNEGISLLGIKDGATALGLSATVGRISPEKLSQCPLPAILHWNQNHFVVLYKIRRGRKFYIADPGKGKIVYAADQFRQHWVSTQAGGEEKGIAMFLEPTPDFGRLSGQEHAENRSFRFLAGYLLQYRKFFLHIMLGLFLGCVLQLLLPFLTQSIVDIGIADRDIGFVWLILLGQLMIVFGRAATDFIRRWFLLHISMRINISLVSDFFIKLLRLPMSFFDTKLMGDLLQRMDDHDRVQSFLTQQTLGVMFSSLSFLVFGGVLLTYDRMIFAIFCTGSLLYGLWIARFLQRRKILDYELFETQSVNQNKTIQFITSMQEIKLQDCERRRRWEWEGVQADLFSVRMKTLKMQQMQEAGSICINEAKNIVITVIAATAVIDGRMTLGMMLAVQYIIGQLNAPVEQLMRFIYSLQDVRISLERINEIHLSRDEESADRNAMSFMQKEKSITIEHLDFKYDKHALRNTLEDISFTVPAGKVTAIVGASGSGKTTLIKLMLGYYPPLKGTLRIAGREIREYNLQWWRRQCGVVMQDGVIFSESIARNIAVSDDDIDIRRLEQAARIANIHDDIMCLPLKYNTLVGRDGMGLSQGQKQRILIARAVYKNPSFIFLDEATNALDAKNERTIVENLDRFYEGRTVVVVAHRLSTVRNADTIIVLNAGRVVETGHHDALIARKGIYYNLVKNQLELGS